MIDKEKILIIDDELGPREAMRMILKDRHSVMTASGAREGFKYLSEDKFDLIMLDIKMPDMDGITALKEIKSMYPEPEVVMVTAYASLETARSAIRYGALDYLIKPFDKDDVTSVVEKGLRKRRAVKEAQIEHERLLDTTKYLESQVEAARENLMSCYEGTLTALILAIDAKDHYTYNHSEHVSKLARAIADALGFSKIMKNKVEQASLIHDMGKIGVDEQILRKQGSLTKSEFDEIRKHPVIGARIVNSVPFLEDAVEVILHHHERFDGTGYPERLKGTNIPLPARIVAIVDAIDAMLRDRPYRKALPYEAVIGELVKGEGTQFDPAIVNLITSRKITLF